MNMEQTFDELKQIVDEYYKNDIKKLQKYFNKFSYANEKDNFPDLISELYIHTIQNIDKLAPIIIKNQYHYYAIKYIFNQRMWSNTKYKQNTQIRENQSDELQDLKIFTPNEYEDEEELLKKEMDIDLKLAKIKIIYDTLPLHEKILFDKYYNRHMSMRKIGKEIGVSQTAIYYMITRIRKKILNCKL